MWRTGVDLVNIPSDGKTKFRTERDVIDEQSTRDDIFFLKHVHPFHSAKDSILTLVHFITICHGKNCFSLKAKCSTNNLGMQQEIAWICTDTSKWASHCCGFVSRRERRTRALVCSIGRRDAAAPGLRPRSRILRPWRQRSSLLEEGKSHSHPILSGVNKSPMPRNPITHIS
jgi:hypothetical protein